MSFVFGDGFDCYAAAADAANGYWDSSAGMTWTFVAGRFAGSQAVNLAVSNSNLVKSSGQNDAVHHLVVAFRQISAITGSTLGGYLQLLDGATAQCSIVFRSDGAILLASGGPAGTVLATYTGAFPVINTWYAYEFEVVVNNTTGSFTVRKNGNTSNDFTLGSLNTRGGTTNNYANRLQFGMGASIVSSHQFDDLFWRSDASSVAWMGDIRCYTRMPASDVSTQFARTPTSAPLIPSLPSLSMTISSNQTRYTPFVGPVTGTITGVSLAIFSATTANIKCAIYSSSSGLPATSLGSATPISAPGAGTAILTFGTPVSITAGTPYFIAICPDASGGNYNSNTAYTTGLYRNGDTYATFPTNNPAITGSGQNPLIVGIATSPAVNFLFVNEPQQDTTTSYVYDSTPGDADFYGIASIASTPASIIAVTTRGYMQKSDAGSRTAAVQLRSGNAVLFTPMTWNPVDKDAAITLSNGNLTATASGTSAVRANGGQSGGKFYWEITATTFLNSASFVGLATAAAVFANSYSQTGVSGITRSGLLYVDNSALTTLGASNSGTVICFAVDLTAKLIWIRYGAAGQWNGSGTANPTTGTGGYSTGAIGGGTAAYPYFSENGVGDAVIANFGASAFVGAVPSGFTSGFGVTTTGTTVQSTPPLTLTTSGWQWAYRTDLNDPATGAAWTPVGVNNCVIGPVVTS